MTINFLGFNENEIYDVTLQRVNWNKLQVYIIFHLREMRLRIERIYKLHNLKLPVNFSQDSNIDHPLREFFVNSMKITRIISLHYLLSYSHCQFISLETKIPSAFIS